MKPYKAIRQTEYMTTTREQEITVHDMVGELVVLKSGKEYELAHIDGLKYSSLLSGFKYKDTAIDFMHTLIREFEEIELMGYDTLKRNFGEKIKKTGKQIVENFKLGKEYKVKNFPWFSSTPITDINPYLYVAPERKKKELPIVTVAKFNLDTGKHEPEKVFALAMNDTFAVTKALDDNGYTLTHVPSGYSIKNYTFKKDAIDLYKEFSKDAELVEFFNFSKKEDMDTQNKYMMSKIKSMF